MLDQYLVGCAEQLPGIQHPLNPGTVLDGRRLKLSFSRTEHGGVGRVL